MKTFAALSNSEVFISGQMYHEKKLFHMYFIYSLTIVLLNSKKLSKFSYKEIAWETKLRKRSGKKKKKSCDSDIVN